MSFYNKNGTTTRDSDAFVVSSTKSHNVPEVHADRVYANSFIHTAAPEAVTASGALSLEPEVALVTSTGNRALTLGDGAYTGQRKTIVQAVGNDNIVLTPSSLLGGTTVTISDLGSAFTVTWINGSWVVTSVNTIGTGVVVA